MQTVQKNIEIDKSLSSATGNKNKRLGQRAIIAGGSLAGLLAARVLANYFDTVLIIDKDYINDKPNNRATTPQSEHTHILLKGGEIALNKLLPGFSEQIEKAGSVKLNLTQEMIYGTPLGNVPRWDAGIIQQSQSRALLEQQIRRRVKCHGRNIHFCQRTTVRGLTLNKSNNKITGVEIEDASHLRSTLTADLVVDASGRGAIGMRWLQALNIKAPRVEQVKVDFAYTSCKLKLRPKSQRDWNAAGGLGGFPPRDARGALMFPIEGEQHMLTIGGRFGVYAPTNEPGFREFIKDFGNDVLHNAIEDALIISPITKIYYPYNRFRHYEEMPNLPKGLLVIGDALCSVNPSYGQGMSGTALQALALMETLSLLEPMQSLDKVIKAYQIRAADIATRLWRTANIVDFAFPRTKGNREMFSDDEYRYHKALQRLAISDEEVRTTRLRVDQFLEPVSALHSASIKQKVAALARATER